MFEELNDAIASKLTSIATIQAAHIETNDRYLRIGLTNEEGYSYEVHEYYTPNKSIGYVVFFYKTDDGKDYKKSVGYGEESENRTMDWFEIINE
jgi:hypothetical protein